MGKVQDLYLKQECYKTMNVEMVQFGCIPCNNTSPEYVKRYEITKEYYQELDAIYSWMQKKMNIPPEEANLEKFVKDSKRAYVPLCANFMMGMWWRHDANEYWQGVGETGEKNRST